MFYSARLARPAADRDALLRPVAVRVCRLDDRLVRPERLRVGGDDMQLPRPVAQLLDDDQLDRQWAEQFGRLSVAAGSGVFHRRAEHDRRVALDIFGGCSGVHFADGRVCVRQQRRGAEVERAAAGGEGEGSGGGRSSGETMTCKLREYEMQTDLFQHQRKNPYNRQLLLILI